LAARAPSIAEPKSTDSFSLGRMTEQPVDNELRVCIVCTVHRESEGWILADNICMFLNIHRVFDNPPQARSVSIYR